MRRLLLVDDDRDLRDCLKDLFATHGYEVSIASDGIEALKLLQHLHFDLILTDIDMPKMNGIEFVKKFRQQDSTTVVVVMTGGVRYSEKEILALGATAFVSKPLPEITSILNLIAA